MKLNSLRKFNGKKLVSYLRQGDYAHAGDIESIIQVMSKFRKNTHRTILDAGCGLGGTANFIQQNGWGKVTGIDIEFDSIMYAKEVYPDIPFYQCDILDVYQKLNTKFDIICLFNTFY